MIRLNVGEGTRRLARNELVEMIEETPIKCDKKDCKVNGRRCFTDDYKNCKVYRFLEKYGNQYAGEIANV